MTERLTDSNKLSSSQLFQFCTAVENIAHSTDIIYSIQNFIILINVSFPYMFTILLFNILDVDF